MFMNFVVCSENDRMSVCRQHFAVEFLCQVYFAVQFVLVFVADSFISIVVPLP